MITNIESYQVQYHSIQPDICKTNFIATQNNISSVNTGKGWLYLKAIVLAITLLAHIPTYEHMVCIYDTLHKW